MDVVKRAINNRNTITHYVIRRAVYWALIGHLVVVPGTVCPASTLVAGMAIVTILDEIVPDMDR